MNIVDRNILSLTLDQALARAGSKTATQTYRAKLSGYLKRVLDVFQAQLKRLDQLPEWQPEQYTVANRLYTAAERVAQALGLRAYKPLGISDSRPHVRRRARL